MTYRKVIRAIMRVRTKNREMSCVDCKINKQNFRTSKKLMHRPSHGMERTGRVSGHERYISCGGSGGYKCYHNWLSFSVLALEMFLRHVVVRNEDVALYEKW